MKNVNEEKLVAKVNSKVNKEKLVAKVNSKVTILAVRHKNYKEWNIWTLLGETFKLLHTFEGKNQHRQTNMTIAYLAKIGTSSTY